MTTFVSALHPKNAFSGIVLTKSFTVKETIEPLAASAGAIEVTGLSVIIFHYYVAARRSKAYKLVFCIIVDKFICKTGLVFTLKFTRDRFGVGDGITIAERLDFDKIITGLEINERI